MISQNNKVLKRRDEFLKGDIKIMDEVNEYKHALGIEEEMV